VFREGKCGIEKQKEIGPGSLPNLAAGKEKEWMGLQISFHS
jgi:hypothetical protein